MLAGNGSEINRFYMMSVVQTEYNSVVTPDTMRLPECQWALFNFTRLDFREITARSWGCNFHDHWFHSSLNDLKFRIQESKIVFSLHVWYNG